MRDDYLRDAQKVVSDPYILINLVSIRVKQLRRGHRPLVESLEKLSPEDTALREIAEGKISFESPPPAARSDPSLRSRRSAFASAPKKTPDAA